MDNPGTAERTVGARRDAAAMAAVAWRVGYLPSGRENVIITSGDVEVDAVAAWEAATAALLGLVERVGRSEFRLVVDGTPVMAMPGLGPDGTVDVDGRGVCRLPQTATWPAGRGVEHHQRTAGMADVHEFARPGDAATPAVARSAHPVLVHFLAV